MLRLKTCEEKHPKQLEKSFGWWIPQYRKIMSYVFMVMAPKVPQIPIDVTWPILSESPEPQSLRSRAWNRKATKSCKGCKNTLGSETLTALYFLFLICDFIKIIKAHHFWWNQQITTVDERSISAGLLEAPAPCFTRSDANQIHSSVFLHSHSGVYYIDYTHLYTPFLDHCHRKPSEKFVENLRDFKMKIIGTSAGLRGHAFRFRGGGPSWVQPRQGGAEGKGFITFWGYVYILYIIILYIYMSIWMSRVSWYILMNYVWLCNIWQLICRCIVSRL